MTYQVDSRLQRLAAEKLKRKQWRSCSQRLHIEALPHFFLSLSHSRLFSSVCVRVWPFLVILLMIPILFKWVDWFMANSFCSDAMLDGILWCSTLVLRYILYLYFSCCLRFHILHRTTILATFNPQASVMVFRLSATQQNSFMCRCLPFRHRTKSNGKLKWLHITFVRPTSMHTAQQSQH